MPEMIKSGFFPDRLVGLNDADLAWNMARSKGDLFLVQYSKAIDRWVLSKYHKTQI